MPEEDTEERVVLGRKDDSTWVGFQWTDAVPENVEEPGVAEEYGAVWEGEELVTYDLDALRRQAEHSDDGYLEDVD